MKKRIFAVLFLVLACRAQAAVIGVGYNNGAPAARVWWNEKLGSELSVGFNYVNDENKYAGGVSYSSAQYVFTVTPFSWAVISEDWGRISLGVKFKALLAYNDNFRNVWGTGRRYYLRMHDYGLIFTLPEIELNVPFVKGLTLVGALGIAANWGYEDNGQYSMITFSAFGPTLGNLGLIYYFDGPKEAKKEAASAPVAVPTAEPAAEKTAN